MPVADGRDLTRDYTRTATDAGSFSVGFLSLLKLFTNCWCHETRKRFYFQWKSTLQTCSASVKWKAALQLGFSAYCQSVCYIKSWMYCWLMLCVSSICIDSVPVNERYYQDSCCEWPRLQTLQCLLQICIVTTELRSGQPFYVVNTHLHCEHMFNRLVRAADGAVNSAGGCIHKGS